MTKAELTGKIASDSGIPASKVAIIVDGFIDTVKSSLTSGEDVILRGFGRFSSVATPARKARDITRDTVIDVPARNRIRFKPSREFRNQLNQD